MCGMDSWVCRTRRTRKRCASLQRSAAREAQAGGIGPRGGERRAAARAVALPRLRSGGSRGAHSRNELGAAARGGVGESWWQRVCLGRGIALGMKAPPDSEFISLVINSKLLYSENAVPLIEQAR